ncbi:TonB-dependent receptor [Thalassotalea litorea]|uniref:TonB-dependent receptor n=1 Tax=Thalassotalea litorea TaxID=2020715 RepID=UPI003736AA43
MSSFKFQKRLLASSIAMVLAGTSGSVVAEEAAAVEEKKLEVIEVTGIRGSLKQNLNAKRFANAVVESISAEDIGKFPDKNIAESLQRVSGVTINRGFTGEGNEVSIRGIDPQLTQVQLNGNFVASTAWFSQSANNRAFNMDLMPSELVAGVDVYKSPQASIDEGGVGGTVIMRTRRPLELDANTLYASVEANTNSLADDTGLGFTGMYSWKDPSETFGVLVTASTLETIGRARKAENYWEEGWSASGVAAFDQDRTRDAIDFTAQFAPMDDLILTGHFFRTELDAFNTNQNFLTINSQWATGLGCFDDGTFTVPGDYCTETGGIRDNLIDPASGARIAPNGLPLTGTAIAPAWLAQDTNTRKAEITTDVIDFTAEYTGDGYTIKAVAGYTESEGGNGGNYNGLWGMAGYNPSFTWADNTGNHYPMADNGVTVDFDMDRQNDMYMAVNGVDAADGTWQMHADRSLTATELSDEEVYFQLDAQFDVELGVMSSIETGIKLRQHEFSQAQNNAVLEGGWATNLADYSNGTISDFGNVMASGSISSYPALDAGKYTKLIDDAVTGWNENLSAYGKVEEDITSLYVQGNFDGDGFRGNVGLRYAGTDITGTSYDPTGELSDVGGDYEDWLPSFNLALDLSDQLILRMSAARVMSRAGYSQLTPSYSNINPTSYTAARGNPDIKPFRATQTDIGLEWYFNDESLLSLAYFTKDIKSFITDKQVFATFPDEDGIDQEWRVTVPAQGRGGNVDGIEFQYQQTFGNFGTVFNYTYTDSEAENDNGDLIQLPGNSQNSYNLTGYYENDTFAARLAYTYRSDFLAPGTAIANQLDTNDEQAFLDANFTWHVTDNLDIIVEGINLTEEVVFARHSGGAQTLRTAVDNGRRYFLKATYRL